MKFKKGDHVVYKCSNPATGWVKRVSKDETWVDVAWDSSMECRYVRRVLAKNILKTNPIFNRLARDPVSRVFIPEAM